MDNPVHFCIYFKLRKERLCEVIFRSRFLLFRCFYDIGVTVCIRGVRYLRFDLTKPRNISITKSHMLLFGSPILCKLAEALPGKK